MSIVVADTVVRATALPYGMHALGQGGCVKRIAGHEANHCAMLRSEMSMVTLEVGSACQRRNSPPSAPGAIDGRGAPPHARHASAAELRRWHRAQNGLIADHAAVVASLWNAARLTAPCVPGSTRRRSMWANRRHTTPGSPAMYRCMAVHLPTRGCCPRRRLKARQIQRWHSRRAPPS